jgi:hypothetical protein
MALLNEFDALWAVHHEATDVEFERAMICGILSSGTTGTAALATALS